MGRKDNIGWSVETYAAHNEALRQAEEKFQAERDRRYAEVNLEREKAVRIREAAEHEARDLAREIQIYKDEKANNLREQINSERGLMAMKSDLISERERTDAMMRPILDYVATRQGGAKGTDKTLFYVITGISILFGLGMLLLAAVTLLMKFKS